MLGAAAILDLDLNGLHAEWDCDSIEADGEAASGLRRSRPPPPPVCRHTNGVEANYDVPVETFAEVTMEKLTGEVVFDIVIDEMPSEGTIEHESMVTDTANAIALIAGVDQEHVEIHSFKAGSLVVNYTILVDPTEVGHCCHP